MKICIDAGHGEKRGKPTGARANGLIEDAWALSFVRRLAHYLRAGGAHVVLTRSEPGLVGLTQRGRIAKREKCDIFLSVHLNAGPATARGAEVFVAQGDVAPKALATEILAEIRAAGIPSRGVKWDSASQYASLAVLRSTYQDMRSMLLEVGFLTSVQDAKLLSDSRWVEDLACRLAKVFRKE